MFEWRVVHFHGWYSLTGKNVRHCSQLTFIFVIVYGSIIFSTHSFPKKATETEPHSHITWLHFSCLGSHTLLNIYIILYFTRWCCSYRLSSFLWSGVQNCFLDAHATLNSKWYKHSMSVECGCSTRMRMELFSRSSRQTSTDVHVVCKIGHTHIHSQTHPQSLTVTRNMVVSF